MINESKQVGMVYHFTSIKSLFKILEQDFLRAKFPNSPNLNHVTKHKGLFISTTRNKNFINHRSEKAEIGGDQVGLVLDGNKLSANYKTIPFDDRWDARDKEWGDWSTIYGDEMEQLWYGKKIIENGGIKNISKYIKGIIITKEGKRAIVNYDHERLPDSLMQKWNWNHSPIEKLEILKNMIQNKLKVDIIMENKKLKELNFTPGFLEQTAEDYDLDLDLVQDVARKSNSSTEFYNELERILKDKANNPHLYENRRNRRNLRKLIERIVERKLNEEYWRVPEDVVDNQVYQLQGLVNSAIESLQNGNDFNNEDWTRISNLVNEIKASAVRHA